MIFWAGVLVAAAFAWLAIKVGFYETWAFVFNILISVYLAIFLGPVLADILPAAGENICRTILTMTGTAIAAFLILHGISYIFFTSQFSTSFPKILDILGAGFLGFLAGLLVWSFASLLIFMTPISKSSFLKNIGFNNQFEQANISYIGFWCELVNRVVSTEANPYSTEEAINDAINKTKSEQGEETSDPAEEVDLDKAEAAIPAEEPPDTAEQGNAQGY